MWFFTCPGSLQNWSHMQHRKKFFCKLVPELKSAMNRELPTATLTRYNHTNQTIPRANLMIRLIWKARKGCKNLPQILWPCADTLWLSQSHWNRGHQEVFMYFAWWDWEYPRYASSCVFKRVTTQQFDWLRANFQFRKKSILHTQWDQ